MMSKLKPRPTSKVFYFMISLGFILITTLASGMTMGTSFGIGHLFLELWHAEGGPVNPHPCSLDQMLDGHWVLRGHTSAELAELEVFLRRTRDFHQLPATLQRDDNKCGNLNFPNHQWHRAVCNPKGATPCCMNNSCVNQTAQECQCPECYDMRQSVHAEFATWVPNNSSCKMRQFSSEEDVCRVLQNKTIYFIGDSFMRQVYTSLLAVLRGNRARHVLRDDVSQANVDKCDKYYRYFADCRYYLIWDSQECNGTLTLKMQYISQFSGTEMKLLKALQGRNDSWFIVGVGSHYFFNFEQVRNNILTPLLKETSPWPRVLWMAAQAPGTLKTPLEKRQQTPALLSFNEKVKVTLAGSDVAILNYFQLTNGTVSYDGTHYGKGVNDAKLQVLLNYLQGQIIK